MSTEIKTRITIPFYKLSISYLLGPATFPRFCFRFEERKYYAPSGWLLLSAPSVSPWSTYLVSASPQIADLPSAAQYPGRKYTINFHLHLRAMILSHSLSFCNNESSQTLNISGKLHGSASPHNLYFTCISRGK